MAETMLQRLYRYYEDKGILSTSFACLHKKQCSAGSPDFTGPKSAFVSTGYENRRSNLPRLLFLSLDSGSIPIIQVLMARSTGNAIMIRPKNSLWDGIDILV